MRIGFVLFRGTLGVLAVALVIVSRQQVLPQTHNHQLRPPDPTAAELTPATPGIFPFVETDLETLLTTYNEHA